eukprot:2386883-Pyramimonas_sp.AAC.1
MTKYLDRPKLDKFCKKLGYAARGGRHELAPQISNQHLDLNLLEEQEWLEPGSAAPAREKSKTMFFDISGNGPKLVQPQSSANPRSTTESFVETPCARNRSP